MVSDVLMSIRPAYAEAILSGDKTVELRRRRPSFAVGTKVLVYATSPEQRVRGAFEVGGVIADAPAALWEAVAHRAALDRAAFDAYFAGAETAYAIEIANARRIAPTPIPIRPPQSYQFLDPKRLRHRTVMRLAAA
jgi:predicted transcriptional regulator